MLDELIEQKHTKETIFIYTDSKILAETIEKDYTNNLDFKSYLSEIKARLPLFDLVIIQWIPENQNKGADNLARQGLQKRLASKNRR